MLTRFWCHETNRWAYGEAIDVTSPQARHVITEPWRTLGTLQSYVPADHFGNGELVSVEEGRAVDLGADASGFTSTWKTKAA